MRQLREILALAIILLAVETPQAWGPVGHETVAYIAEDELGPAVKEKIGRILGVNVELADVANWADSIRAFRRYTASWHFIDLDVRQTLTEDQEPRFCGEGDCVVGQVNKDISVLKDSEPARKEKQEALKFLIHFMGDLHQPLHCADDGDRGGNEKIVRYVDPGGKWGRRGRGRKIKLHALWDHLIELRAEEDPRALASLLERNITAAERKTWASGSAADWAWESYGIAKTQIFSEFSPGPTSDPHGLPLPEDYYTGKMRAIVDKQLEKAGVRLAYVLNGVFGP